MTPDLATFRILFPEFASIPDAIIQLWLDDAIDTLNESTWGKCYAKAVLYYSAHNLSYNQITQSQSSVTSGGQVTNTPISVVESASDEKLSISYGINQSSTNGSPYEAFLQLTPYGQYYAALKRECLPSARLITCQ